MTQSNKTTHPAMLGDYYSFKHRTEMVRTSGRDKEHPLSVERPLWIVGNSPFDKVVAPDEGHVVHLGSPRFTAKWTMAEETLQQITSTFFDEDLNLALYEVVPLDITFNESELESWLAEAAYAVAFTKGLIAEMVASEEH